MFWLNKGFNENKNAIEDVKSDECVESKIDADEETTAKPDQEREDNVCTGQKENENKEKCMEAAYSNEIDKMTDTIEEGINLTAAEDQKNKNDVSCHEESDKKDSHGKDSSDQDSTHDDIGDSSTGVTAEHQSSKRTDIQEQEDYINGLITFIKFIDRFFERFTHLQNEGILDFYKEYGAHTFTKGFIKTILHDLQNANLLFNKVIKSNNLVFLVEGQSEEAFIKNYYQHFDGDVSVYSYKGEGNAKGGNLHILIDFFLENNHAVFVQVDLDNKNNKHQQLEKHKEKYKDKDVYFFAFKNNLEESYPYELVTEALGHIYSDFNPKMLGNKETTYKDLLARIDINIDDIKIDLAIIIAQLVYRKGRRGVHFNANDEIYGFADFIDNAYPKSQEKSKYYNYWKDEEQQNNER